MEARMASSRRKRPKPTTPSTHFDASPHSFAGPHKRKDTRPTPPTGGRLSSEICPVERHHALQGQASTSRYLKQQEKRSSRQHAFVDGYSDDPPRETSKTPRLPAVASEPSPATVSPPKVDPSVAVLRRPVSASSLVPKGDYTDPGVSSAPPALHRGASSSSVDAPKSTKGAARWTKEEDRVLAKAVQQYNEDWDAIARYFPRHTPRQCQVRWLSVVKPGFVRGPWSKSEDNLLTTIVNRMGIESVKWSTVASSLPGRVGKQCRERWFNHLDPNIRKGNWTPDEDRVIFEMQKLIGNRWSEIAKALHGRSENAVKNRFNSAARKRYFLQQSGAPPSSVWGVKDSSHAPPSGPVICHQPIEQSLSASPFQFSAPMMAPSATVTSQSPSSTTMSPMFQQQLCPVAPAEQSQYFSFLASQAQAARYYGLMPRAANPTGRKSASPGRRSRKSPSRHRSRRTTPQAWPDSKPPTPSTEATETEYAGGPQKISPGTMSALSAMFPSPMATAAALHGISLLGYSPDASVREFFASQAGTPQHIRDAMCVGEPPSPDTVAAALRKLLSIYDPPQSTTKLPYTHSSSIGPPTDESVGMMPTPTSLFLRLSGSGEKGKPQKTFEFPPATSPPSQTGMNPAMYQALKPHRSPNLLNSFGMRQQSEPSSPGPPERAAPFNPATLQQVAPPTGHQPDAEDLMFQMKLSEENGDPATSPFGGEGAPFKEWFESL